MAAAAARRQGGVEPLGREAPTDLKSAPRGRLGSRRPNGLQRPAGSAAGRNTSELSMQWPGKAKQYTRISSR